MSAQGLATVFDHVAVDWNPHGHETSGIYNAPHWDFPFYMVLKNKQTSIPAYEADTAKFKAYPDAKFMPASYVPVPGGVAMIGAHWIDVTLPFTTDAWKLRQWQLPGFYKCRYEYFNSGR